VVIFSKIIDVDPTILVTSQQNATKSSQRTLKNLDRLAVKIGEIIAGTNIIIMAGSKNLAFLISYTTPNELLISSTEAVNDILGLTITHTNSTNKSSLTSFQTGKRTFEKNDAIIIYSFLFKNDALFQTETKVKKQVRMFLKKFR